MSIRSSNHPLGIEPTISQPARRALKPENGTNISRGYSNRPRNVSSRPLLRGDASSVRLDWHTRHSGTTELDCVHQYYSASRCQPGCEFRYDGFSTFRGIVRYPVHTQRQRPGIKSHTADQVYAAGHMPVSNSTAHKYNRLLQAGGIEHQGPSRPEKNRYTFHL